MASYESISRFFNAVDGQEDHILRPIEKAQAEERGIKPLERPLRSYSDEEFDELSPRAATQSRANTSSPRGNVGVWTPEGGTQYPILKRGRAPQKSKGDLN
jgi:hypothetical protein